jgi:gamma-glutamylcyclotransferase (GGCT)/AIG2-like uncharacterized protein YtfP
MSETHIPIFAYGILRKKSWLQAALQEFDVKGVQVSPAKIKGFIPYHSGAINIVFPVTDKQKQKYPNADFTVHGSLLYFYGDVNNIMALLKYIDDIEMGYYKELVTTTDETQAYVYLMSPKMRRFDLVKIYGLGLVVYPDSVLDRQYVTKNESYSNDDSKDTEDFHPDDNQETINEGFAWTYEHGRMPISQISDKYRDYIG